MTLTHVLFFHFRPVAAVKRAIHSILAQSNQTLVVVRVILSIEGGLHPIFHSSKTYLTPADVICSAPRRANSLIWLQLHACHPQTPKREDIVSPPRKGLKSTPQKPSLSTLPSPPYPLPPPIHIDRLSKSHRDPRRLTPQHYRSSNSTMPPPGLRVPPSGTLLCRLS